MKEWHELGRTLLEPKTPALKACLVIICIAVLAITLTAGLWPFSFHPKNRVEWLPGEAGLRFSGSGMAVSDGNFPGFSSNRGVSIELWIEPSLTWDSSTILSFYEPKTLPLIQVRQSGDDLVFTSSRGPEQQPHKLRNVFVDHAFRKGEAVFVTFTSAGEGFDVYVNGELKKTINKMQMRGADFSGTLILANAPYGNLSWRGVYRGLAFYDRALGIDEIKWDYDSWRGARERIAAKKERPQMLYLFDATGGDRVDNLGRSGPDLKIPKTYSIMEPGFLVPFWKEFSATTEYAKDLAINIFGLVPLGFCFAALLAWRCGSQRSFWYTTILGFCVSLTIELLQAFMPTRFSGTTDLITNTSGTALGAWLFLNGHTRIWLRQIGFLR